MIDIESKIISYREDTNDYRLCLTREEIEDIKYMREDTIDECEYEIVKDFSIYDDTVYAIIKLLRSLKEKKK